MILRYIKLKNFCPYYDEQTIHFATDEHRNVTVIRGVNGTGKTSLLTALNWCLYGDSFFKEDSREFVNRHALANAENVETSVELGFVDQEIEYRVERKRQWLLDNKTTFLLQEEDEDPDFDSTASDKIRSIIPEDVSAHFFFDGEKIDNFAKQGNESEIRSAVHSVLRIEVFERGIAHLERTAQDYQRELKRYAHEKLKALLTQREEQVSLRDNLSKQMENKQNEIKTAEKQKQDIDKWLEEFEDTRLFFEEQKELTTKLKEVRDKRNQNRENIREIANDGFIPLAKSALSNALKILQKNEAIIGIPDEILINLLEQMRCLCGRTFHNESPEYRNIQHLISQNISSEFGIAVRETQNNLKHLLEYQVETIPTNLKLALKNDIQLEKDIERKEARLDEIKKKLENFDDDDFRNHKDRQDEYIKDIAYLSGQMNQIKENIQKIKIGIDELDKKINKEKSKETKAERLKRCLELAKESASEMRKFYAPFEEDMRKDLQTEVSKIFKMLVWKKKSFSEVCLSSNYELQVIDRYNDQVSSEISAGEREVLSLAFIAALAKAAVKEKLPEIQPEHFPIVMDAPFTKLSDEPKENITRTIPDIANQLILFLTDQELKNDEEAWRNLKPRIGTVYELDFDDEESITRIKQIE